MALKVGDIVSVKPGKEHDTMTKGKLGMISEISTPAIGIMFEGMHETHKWYTEAELKHHEKMKSNSAM